MGKEICPELQGKLMGELWTEAGVLIHTSLKSDYKATLSIQCKEHSEFRRQRKKSLRNKISLSVINFQSGVLKSASV